MRRTTVHPLMRNEWLFKYLFIGPLAGTLCSVISTNAPEDLVPDDVLLSDLTDPQALKEMDRFFTNGPSDMRASYLHPRNHHPAEWNPLAYLGPPTPQQICRNIITPTSVLKKRKGPHSS